VVVKVRFACCVRSEQRGQVSTRTLPLVTSCGSGKGIGGPCGCDQVSDCLSSEDQKPHEFFVQFLLYGSALPLQQPSGQVDRLQLRIGPKCHVHKEHLMSTVRTHEQSTAW